MDAERSGRSDSRNFGNWRRSDEFKVSHSRQVRTTSAKSTISRSLAQIVATPQSAQVAAGLFVLVAGGLFIAAAEGQRQDPVASAALVFLFLGLWLTKIASDHLAAILFFGLAVGVIGIPTDVAFAGFQSGAVWLVLGGLIVGATIRNTGLGERIANSVLTRIGGSFAAMVWGAVVAGTILAFLIPSATARVLILTPVMVALADQQGYGPGSAGRTGLVLAATLGTLLPSYGILPAAIPQIAMAGNAHAIYGIDITYGGYLLANFPVLALSAVIVVPAAICLLYRTSVRRRVELERRDPPSSDEKRLIIILCVALALWTTDFVHGVPAAWIGLGAGVLCLIPGFGPGRTLAFNQSVNFGLWLVVAALISMGAILNYGGLGQVSGPWLAERLVLTPGATVWNLVNVTGIGLVVNALVTTLGAPTIMTTLAQQFALATGWSLETTLLTQVPTWAFSFLPYQNPILMIGIAIGGVSFWQATRLLLVVCPVGLFVITPLHYLWLGCLGYLG